MTDGVQGVWDSLEAILRHIPRNPPQHLDHHFLILSVVLCCVVWAKLVTVSSQAFYKGKNNSPTQRDAEY